jgi:RNA polymerase sigma-70 factor, ECF subfamily
LRSQLVQMRRLHLRMPHETVVTPVMIIGNDEHHVRRRFRAKNRGKRGGGWDRITFSSPDLAISPPGTTVATVCEVLERLRERDESQYYLAILRYYVCMTMDDIAKVLGVSKRNLERQWTFVKAWLQNELSKGETR